MSPFPVAPCGICTGDPARKLFVNAELVRGTPHTQIERKSRELGMPVKRETVRRHVNVCVAVALAESTAARQRVGVRWAKRDAGAEAVPASVPANDPPRTPRSRPTPTTPAPQPPPPPVTAVTAVITPLLNLPAGDDFATLIKAAAVEKLRAGELRVTTQDGLNAQSLLDRREEKQKDRELLTQLGILLSRGSIAPPTLNDLIDVTPSEDADEPLLIEG